MASLRPLCRLFLGTPITTLSHYAAPAASSSALGNTWYSQVSSFLGFHTSASSAGGPPATAVADTDLSKDPRYNLLDKDVWDEVWAYEDRFGTAESPIVVPSVERDRIIGVTDPEDDGLVIWGILTEGDPPRQLVEGGEYYVLQRVESIKRVGDLIDEGKLPPVAPSSGH